MLAGWDVSGGSWSRSTSGGGACGTAGAGSSRLPSLMVLSREVKLLLDHHDDLVRERTQKENRLREHLFELDPEFRDPGARLEQARLGPPAQSPPGLQNGHRGDAGSRPDQLRPRAERQHQRARAGPQEASERPGHQPPRPGWVRGPKCFSQKVRSRIQAASGTDSRFKESIKVSACELPFERSRHLLKKPASKARMLAARSASERASAGVSTLRRQGWRSRSRSGSASWHGRAGAP